MTAVTADQVAAQMTRHTALRLQARPSVLELARQLLALREAVPAGHCLLVGGSLARGEAAFIPAGGDQWELASDVDLVLLHTTSLPELSAEQLDAHARPHIPTATTMTLSVEEYGRLGTCLGREFKRGITLAGQPPACDPVELDTRDGYELLLYAVQSWCWDGLSSAWQNGHTTSLDTKINRVCLKALRACVILGGGDRCSDLDAAPAPLRARLQAELTARTNPGMHLHPARFWPLIADVLACFDQQIGPQPDAVTATAYAHRPGAAAVAEQQRLAHALARLVWVELAAMPIDVRTTIDADTTVHVQRSAWREVVERGLARPAYSVEEHFRPRVGGIRADMIRLKTTSDITPAAIPDAAGAPWPWPPAAVPRPRQ